MGTATTAPLRFAVFGAGFWAHYQLSAWREVPGATCVALYNRTRARAEEVARRFDIPVVYDDPAALLQQERPDFVDIITAVGTHPWLVELGARYGIPVVCQKPMAPSLEVAERMLATCRRAGVPFIVHENWRWQTPLRQVKALLESGAIGQPFRARIQFSSGFPVFENQPFLKELEQFILTDIGSHILDVARFLSGEASSLYCQTARIHRDIRGEDVATVMMRMGTVTCTCEMSYASILEHDPFPHTLLLIEGEAGSLDLSADYSVRVTAVEGTISRRYPPPRYAWADPAYALVQASIVPCNGHILHALRSGERAETDAEDNIKTVRLVFGAYASSRQGQVTADI